ncbi:MAG: aspartate carbamoyltransferase [Bacteroidales bacterium]|nr:aspartate carbamoyltransferase [Bacteroidales bacterium]
MVSKSLVSITDCTKEEYLRILNLAKEFEANPHQNILNGKIVATLFFEPSTRTRLSFESAVLRLGGRIIGFSEASSSSSSKGETFSDTIRTVSNYCDLLIIRHPLEGTARLASELTSLPVINAGDGSNQHPTQTLLDMYSIQKTQGRLDNLTLTLVGDLKYGRTVHSLIMAMATFKPVFYFVSPEELKLPDDYRVFLKQNNIEYHETTQLPHAMKVADIVYMTRVQRERFLDPMEYEKTKNAYILKAEMLSDTKPNMKVLHPLPRINEISTDVDSTDKAYYFQQALNGVYTRQAIISHVLGLK